MRTVHEWLDEYAESHHNPVNKTLHWICVPLIMLSLVGLLWSIPVPAAWAAHSAFVNFGVLLVILALIYYYLLDWRLALGMTLVMIIVVAIVYGVSRLPAPLW